MRALFHIVYDVPNRNVMKFPVSAITQCWTPLSKRNKQARVIAMSRAKFSSFPFFCDMTDNIQNVDGERNVLDFLHDQFSPKPAVAL
ncbi:hypothetical protein F9K81_11210 [Brucella anthropi]|uniref:Uncharacterized protein n=1 Tax=Brucella anthropi TaxID=529 RepID=A0A6I0DUM2_BRUAN|nr:hypothetical protein F9K89_04210 [Brucella anthropi]MCR5939547.1 hypothetical protein [Ochrobactrum sp. XJ1]PQZ62892.1 hypothetical protein CQ057_15770 [Ochrobactrum sp. MYb49]KAB2757916.1 hypothetical protein F9K81_11210 [Brucella anthropi]KAB2769431.1 hypothetical protein F9K84_09255 [Brucella anthropi]